MIATTTGARGRGPSTNASLTSPIPIPDGREQRGHEQEAAGPEGRDQSSGRSREAQRGGEREPGDGERQRDAVGDDAVAQVDRS